MTLLPRNPCYLIQLGQKLGRNLIFTNNILGVVTTPSGRSEINRQHAIKRTIEISSRTNKSTEDKRVLLKVARCHDAGSVDSSSGDSMDPMGTKS